MISVFVLKLKIRSKILVISMHRNCIHNNSIKMWNKTNLLLGFLVVVLLMDQASSFGISNRLGLQKFARISNRLKCSGKTNLVNEKDVVINTNLGDRSYPIYIGTDLLNDGTYLKTHISSLKTKKALIVTNTVVDPLYTKRVLAILEASNIEAYTVVLPDGEEHKNMNVLLKIIDAALEHKLDRSSVFLALGGGVIGDMCGFAASIYQRGVPVIQLPTSLMAMVDSSVGGKTAVNHPAGKNMIGTFYQPDAVIMDTNTLDTLPKREFLSGLSEVAKYGLLHDAAFFHWLRDNAQDLTTRSSPDKIAYMIEQSCLNKARIVALDEKESVAGGGVRAWLNLGHTFGHAVETGVGYGVWLHGEAVSVGIVMAADFSYRLGLIPLEQFQEIVSLLRALQLPVTLFDNQHAVNKTGGPQAYREIIQQSLTATKFRELMSLDKKVSNGALNLVLLQGELGRVIITKKYDENILSQMIEEYVSDKVNLPA